MLYCINTFEDQPFLGKKRTMSTETFGVNALIWREDVGIKPWFPRSEKQLIGGSDQ